MSWGKMKPSAGGGGGSEKAPAGNHPAVLVAIVDMGEQWQEPYSPGDKGYWTKRAYFVWELVQEKKSGSGENHTIAIDLTMSLGSKAKLRKFIEGRLGRKLLDGEDFDILAEVGQSCLLNVVEKNGYPKIDGCAALPKGFPALNSSYPLTRISLDEFRNGTAIPDWVPYLYGSPLADHIRACKQIGGEKPSGKKSDLDKGPIPF